jgi:dihydrodipicolinate synthase/N-acetylneuraminate lyase
VTDICAAVYTPYKDDGTVDTGAIDSQAAFLAKQRVPYVFGA